MLAFLLASFAHAAPFTEADLNRTLKRSCAGARKCVFYTWSPHMPLSSRGRDDLMRYARAHSIQVFTLLDPDADPKLADQERVREKWPLDTLNTVSAETLFKLGVRIHYPSYVFATRGRIQSPLIPGAQVGRDLAELERKYLK